MRDWSRAWRWLTGDSQPARPMLKATPEPPVQLGVQLWEDAHSQGHEYAAYYGLDRKAPDRPRFASLIESYVRNEVGIYVDIAWAVEGSTFDHRHATALLYWPREGLDASDLDAGLVELDGEGTAPWDCADSREEAVLVDFGQFLKLPEGMKNRVLPAMVGLQAPDARSRRAGHSFRFVSRPTSVSFLLASPESLFGLEDRKGRVSWPTARRGLWAQCYRPRVGRRDGPVPTGGRSDAIPNQDAKVGVGGFDVDGPADNPTL